jgi:hypothetical protein
VHYFKIISNLQHGCATFVFCRILFNPMYHLSISKKCNEVGIFGKHTLSIANSSFVLFLLAPSKGTMSDVGPFEYHVKIDKAANNQWMTMLPSIFTSFSQAIQKIGDGTHLL